MLVEPNCTIWQLTRIKKGFSLSVDPCIQFNIECRHEAFLHLRLCIFVIIQEDSLSVFILIWIRIGEKRIRIRLFFFDQKYNTQTMIFIFLLAYYTYILTKKVIYF